LFDKVPTTYPTWACAPIVEILALRDNMEEEWVGKAKTQPGNKPRVVAVAGESMGSLAGLLVSDRAQTKPALRGASKGGENAK
jgi:hypothetical protein